MSGFKVGVEKDGYAESFATAEDKIHCVECKEPIIGTYYLGQLSIMGVLMHLKVCEVCYSELKNKDDE